MLVWGALVIPFATAVILYVAFKHRTVWWELLIPLTVSLVVIAICKVSTEAIQTRDTEFWGGWLVQAEYYEAWNESVPCRHPRYETRTRTVTRTDASGRSYTDTEMYEEFVGYEHLYDVDYHPPYWQVVDSNGIIISVSEGEFEKLAQEFGNRQFVELHRNSHTIDGDEYVARWPGDEATLVPVTTVHTYENRVQASGSLFNFQEVDPELFGLFDYPDITNHYHCPVILGDGGPTAKQAERIFAVANARLGHQKQVRLWILVFVSQPLEAGFAQENFWKGGNKNEFIVTIGVNDRHEVEWCYPFSWTEVESLQVETRNHVLDQKGEPLDLVEIANWLPPQIEQQFVRKEFADFSYLTVEPPGWAIGLSYFLTLLVNAGLSLWIVRNEHSNRDSERGFRHF